MILRYVLIALLAVIALAMTYLSDKISKFLFKKETADIGDSLKIKVAAFAVGVTALILALTLI